MSNSEQNPITRPRVERRPLPEGFDFALAGAHARVRRLQFGLSTHRLAEIAGVARQTIIRLEKGQPIRYRSLQQIRSALHLFTDQLQRPLPDETRFAIHRAANHRWSVSIPKASYQRHLTDDDPIHVDEESERRRLGALGLQPFFTSVMDSELPGGSIAQALMELHRPSWVDNHFGEEFVYCLNGPVIITIDGVQCRLEAGDAVTFDANLPHMYEPAFEVQDKPALILVVVSKKHGERRPRPSAV